MTDTQTKPFRRWYDHDPRLIEVLELLRSFPNDVRGQAEVFLTKIEEQLGPDQVEKFHAILQPEKTGNRWYDHDPVISKAVELLRVVPPDVQRKAAEKFLESMRKQGISPELLKNPQ